MGHICSLSILTWANFDFRWRFVFFVRKLLEKDPDALAGLSINLANDLKEAMERLNQNPSNSSKPSGSLAPWDKGSRDNEEDEELEHEDKEALNLSSSL